MWLPGGNFRLSEHGTLEFTGHGPTTFDLYNGIQEVNDALRNDLFNVNEHVLYTLGIVCSENCQNKFTNIQGLIRSISGHFGEFDLEPNGYSIVPGSSRSQPVLWLRLRATKIGQSGSWRLFFEKMDNLQRSFGFAQLGM